jgi:hypothetical protein
VHARYALPDEERRRVKVRSTLRLGSFDTLEGIPMRDGDAKLRSSFGTAPHPVFGVLYCFLHCYAEVGRIILPCTA